MPATIGSLPILSGAASTTVVIENSVAITDLSVIESPLHTFNPCTLVGNPNGVWTFGHLMTELAGSMHASDFVHAWLDE